MVSCLATGFFVHPVSKKNPQNGFPHCVFWSVEAIRKFVEAYKALRNLSSLNPLVWDSTLDMNCSLCTELGIKSADVDGFVVPFHFLALPVGLQLVISCMLFAASRHYPRQPPVYTPPTANYYQAPPPAYAPPAGPTYAFVPHQTFPNAPPRKLGRFFFCGFIPGWELLCVLNN